MTDTYQTPSMAVEQERQCNCLDLYMDLKRDVVALLRLLLRGADESDTIASLILTLREALQLNPDFEIEEDTLAHREAQDDMPMHKHSLLRTALKNILRDCRIQIDVDGDMEVTTAIEDYIHEEFGGGYLPTTEENPDDL